MIYSQNQSCKFDFKHVFICFNHLSYNFSEIIFLVVSVKRKEKDVLFFIFKWYIFFPIGVFLTDTDDSQDSREKEGAIFDSTLTLPPAHEHRDIYLQLCMWNDYHVFLMATLVFTRLLVLQANQMSKCDSHPKMIFHG